MNHERQLLKDIFLKDHNCLENVKHQKFLHHPEYINFHQKYFQNQKYFLMSRKFSQLDMNVFPFLDNYNSKEQTKELTKEFSYNYLILITFFNFISDPAYGPVMTQFSPIITFWEPCL